MKERTKTALLLVLAVIPVFFSIKYLYFIVAAIALIVAFELNDLISDKKYPIIIALTFLLIVSFGYDFIASRDKLIVAGSFLLIIVLLDLIYNDIGFNNLSLIYTISLLLGFAVNGLIYLYILDGYFVWYVLLVNYGSDTGAYLIGSKFGKNKLIPHISPNKTIEGAIGGVLFGAILGSIFGSMFLSGHLDVKYIILISFIMPTIAQLGDLFFSSLKRSFNKKDFGALFPGHGGALDRIDSLIFSLVFMIIFIRFGYLGGLI